MGLDPDPFDDIFSDNTAKNNNTRAGGKFQPKAKRGPTRKASAVPSSPSSQRVETGDSAQVKSGVAIQTEKAPEPYGERCLDSANPMEHAANEETVGQSVTAPPDSDDVVTEWRSCFEKSVGENGDIFLGIESFEGFLPHSTTGIDNSTTTETPAIVDNQNAKDRLASPVIDHATDSGCTSNIADNPTSPELSPAQDPLTHGQPIVSISEGGCDMHDGRLESEQIESYTCLESREISGLTTTSGRRTGKFQPKPKIQLHKEMTEASTAKLDKGDSIVGQMNEHMGPSEIEDMDKGSLSLFGQDDALNFSSLGLDSILREPTSELLADEQPTNLKEASQAETDTREEHVEAASAMREKIAIRRAKAGKSKNVSVSDRHLNQQNVLTSNGYNVAGRMLRPRPKRGDEHRLVDESEDEETDEEFPAECPDQSFMDEANDEDFREENGTQANKRQRKSKKRGDEKERPVRKRKKAGEAPEQATAKAPKKFSHSTRQKRRRIVDKELLETPEDEIDFQKVSLRDLIVLADYKERIAKKEAANLEAHLNSQSAGTTSTHRNEDEGYASEQGEEDDDGEESPKVQEASGYFNYQTYMDKTPSTRWSKKDTELFYEAVQQFGTDLSMIQQLFPGRSRRQIKLKYKKEERQHPLRLREALFNRGNDHSYFKQVIERLQQIAAENKQDSSKDETISLPDDEEAEQMRETNEEAAKSEQPTEQGKVEGSVAPDVSVQSPRQDYDSETDLFDWNEYKS